MTGDKAVRVSGHKKDLHRGMTRSEAFCQDAPIYSRHHYVCEEQMNRAGGLRRYMLGFSPVRWGQDVIPVFLQEQLRQQPQRFRVFYQQNGLGSTYSRRRWNAL